jgi:hypothetical protein
MSETNPLCETCGAPTSGPKRRFCGSHGPARRVVLGQNAAANDQSGGVDEGLVALPVVTLPREQVERALRARVAELEAGIREVLTEKCLCPDHREVFKALGL